MTTMTAATTPQITIGSAAAHYKRPDWFTRNVMNPFLNLMMRLGISVLGSRVLEHRGRRSGQLHHTPVNLLTIEGQEYLVSPRGESEWVRNVKAANGHLVLAIGRRRHIYTATEVPVADRVEILRTYLRRWKFEVGMFFDGVGPDSTDEEFAAVAAQHPVFALRS
ncbi:MAG TPA: nitroreductase family deazaflavin-dependent oxidoreductase [Acidimicrobiales bacterium]|jgi:deazaflavin-dependent oxidoreductase (nitroreductase family)|nr:nitroreductase family deazaflavin-dependent oxidoreductase [Acidimicrobiales bacterium]